jgi:beta-phosphoglucomutase family hydrolase
MPIHGLIFDCDGTLADTMPWHYEAWMVVLDRYELEMGEERFYALGGWPTKRVAELLVSESGRSLDVEKISREKETIFEDMIPRIAAIPQVADAVRENHGKLPMAVATGAIMPICKRILRQIRLEGCFHTIVSSEDVVRHKPAPDIFLEAARRLEVEPAHCLVYEDTDPGVQAARTAGMECVDVRAFHVPRRVT